MHYLLGKIYKIQWIQWMFWLPEQASILKNIRYGLNEVSEWKVWVKQYVCLNRKRISYMYWWLPLKIFVKFLLLLEINLDRLFRPTTYKPSTICVLSFTDSPHAGPEMCKAFQYQNVTKFYALIPRLSFCLVFHIWHSYWGYWVSLSECAWY